MSNHEPTTIAKLDALEHKLPGLLAEFPDDADFWNAFAGESESIADGTPRQTRRTRRGVPIAC